MSWEAWGDDDAGSNDHLIDAGWWDNYRVDDVRDAVRALFAEPIYEGGKKGNGISVRFLMRMQMLRYYADLAGEDDPFIAEALAAFRGVV